MKKKIDLFVLAILLFSVATLYSAIDADKANTSQTEERNSILAETPYAEYTYIYHLHNDFDVMGAVWASCSHDNRVAGSTDPAKYYGCFHNWSRLKTARINSNRQFTVTVSARRAER